MQRKLNDEFVREYSEEFSEKIASGFFESKDRITGKEILSITSSKQVNFFILKILFRKWQEEMKRLESPYFNYKNTEVRKAMVTFMNVLSQNIEVEREAFLHMTSEAVADTLLLATHPGSYLVMEFEELDVEKVTLKLTNPILKYLKLHKEVIKSFFQEQEGEEIDDFLETAEGHFDDLDVNAAVTEELEKLSTTLSISEADLYLSEDVLSFREDDDVPNLLDDEEIEEGETGDDEGENFFDESTESSPREDDPEYADDETSSEETSDLGELKGENAYNADEEIQTETYDEDSLEEAPEEVEDADHEFSDNEMAQEAESLDPDEQTLQTAPDQEDSPDDQEEESPMVATHTLNDRFSQDRKTLADEHQQRKVPNIMSAISVNHRYMFTKELFDGDREAFTAAIEKIESCLSFDEAVEMIVQSYAKERSWDMNSEEVKELLKVIFRKFR